MAIKVPTLSEIEQEIVQEIPVDAKTGIALYPHSPDYDRGVIPLRDSIYDLKIITDFTNRSSNLLELEQIVKDPAYQDRLRFALNISFPDVQALISSAIDNLISNWNEKRRDAQKARGYIRLYFNSGSNVTLSAGVIIETLDGIRFQTTNSFNNFSPVYLPSEGLYYLDSAIEALATGQNGNVEIGSIINIVSGATNLVKVLNIYRTQFGRDKESDLEVIDQNRDAWTSRRTSVLKGFTDKLLNYSGVLDVSVIMQGDSLMTRTAKNAVDVYLLSEEKLQAKEDLFSSIGARYAWERLDDELNFATYPTAYDGSSGTAFKLLSQPSMSISTISYSATPTGTFTSIGNSFSHIIDSTSVYAYSVKGQDRAVLNAGAIPNNVYVKINYVYDRLFKDLQELFNIYENRVIGADVLFKKALKQTVDIQIYDMVILSGFVLSDMQNTINSDLRIFFEGGIDSNNITRLASKLGSRLDKSDLLQLVLNVEGLDRMDTDRFKVLIDGTEMGETDTANLNSYFRFGTVSFLTSGQITGTRTITNNQTTGT